MKKPKKVLALLMALAMTVSLAPTSYGAFAEDVVVEESVTTEQSMDAVGIEESSTETESKETVSEEADATEVTSDDTDDEEVEEATSEETEVVTEADEEISEETEEATKEVTEEVTEEVTDTEDKEDVTEEVTEEATEEVTEEEPEVKEPSFATAVPGVSTSDINFSSKELLIGTDNENVFTWDTEVVSSYEGVYLTRYATVDECRNAYTYYYNKVDFVAPNITFTVSDEEGDKADLSNLNEGDDALANLNDLNLNGSYVKDTIALIDTGVNATGLVDSVSVIGEGTSDDNGHGTRMYNFIKEEYPGAKVLSIKAFDANGQTKADAIYAAIQYAIEKGATVINLSASAYSSEKNAAVKDIINDATKAGIKFVGAAGNGGKNVKYYIPGSIDSAIIVGSCDENGTKLNTSNYGDTVDYNVVSESTSEAAARMSAIWTRDHGFVSDKIFVPGEDEQEELELIADEDTFKLAANPEPWDNVDGTPLEKGDVVTGSYKITARWGTADNGYGGAGGVYSNRFTVELTSGLLDDYTGTFKCIDPGVSAGGGSGSYTGTYTATVSDFTTSGSTDTITWNIQLSRPAPGTQRMKIVSDYSYSRTRPKYYYMVVRKLAMDDKGKWKNENYVTFDMKVNGVKIQTEYTLKNDDDGKAKAAQFGGYKLPHTFTQAVWTGYQRNFDDTAIADAIEGKTSGSVTIASSKYHDYRNPSGLPAGLSINGFCLMYLGQFDTKPNVTIAENWTSDRAKTFITDNGEWYQAYIYQGETKDQAKQKAFNVMTNANGTLARTTWKNPTAPKYYYTSAWKSDGTRDAWDNRDHQTANHRLYKISMEGTVIGLYDDISCTADHLVCRFYLDEDGYAKTIKDDRGTGVFDKYISKAETWNIYAKVGEDHHQRVVCLNQLDDDDQKFYYKEMKAADGFILNETPVLATVQNSGIKKSDTKITKKDGETEYLLSQFAAPVDGTWPNGKKHVIYKLPVEIKNYRRVYAYVKKTSSNGNVSTGNPNYSLEGTQYLAFNTNADATAFRNAAVNPSSTAYATAEEKSIFHFVVDANGESDYIDVSEAFNSTKELEDGKTFYIVESKAGKGYKRDTRIHTLNVGMNNYIATPIATGVEENKAAKLPVTDEPVNDPFQLELVKRDGVGGDTLPEGKTLAGAEFKVTFYAVDNTTMHTSADLKANYSNKIMEAYCQTITTKEVTVGGKKRYIANIGKDKNGNPIKFPLGFITVEETKAPKDYSLKDATVSIKDANGNVVANVNDMVFVTTGDFSNNQRDFDGVTIYPNGATTLAAARQNGINLNDAIVTYELDIEEAPIRGNIQINKKADVLTGDPIEGVRFRIDRVKAAKDDNKYTADDILETHYIYTNAEGHATTVTTKYENVNYYDGPKAYDKTNATVWFENGADGQKLAPKDGYAALAAGTYCITEEKTDANKGYQMAKPWTFTISKENQTETYQTYADGSVYNVPKPEIDTVATAVLRKEGDANYEEAKMCPASAGREIKDVVSYTNLKADTEYTLVSRIMEIQKDGTVVPFKQGDDEVVITNTFTTDPAPQDAKTDLCATDSYEVFFKDLDFTGLQDRKYVVYETLYLGTVTEGDGILKNYVDANPEDEDFFPVDHSEPDDEDQQFHTPTGGTEATGETGTKTITYTDKIRLKDVISFKGLEVGREYECTGTLYLRPENAKEHDEYTEEELAAMMLKDKDGNPITATVTHTPTEPDGEVEVWFEFDADLITGESETLCVFENDSDKNTGISVFTHANINDKGQTVYKPAISTTAMDTNGRSELAAESEKFYDKITLTNLEANREYRVVGVAMNKKTKKVLTLGGEEVTAQDTFTTGDSNRENGAYDGEFTLEFEITKEMQKDLPGVDMVIYETLYVQDLDTKEWKVAAQHCDIDDIGQELKVPTLKTTLLDKKTKTHIAYPDETCTLVDEVRYSGLIPSKKYVMEGVIHIQDENETVLTDKDGNPVTAKKEFTASDTGEGVVKLTFTFSAQPLYLERKTVVAFESCYPLYDKIPCAVHANINDKDQQVQYPSVGTKASMVKKSVDTAAKTATFVVTDQIMLSNLNTKYTYVAKASLVDRKTGKVVKLNNEELRAELEFKVKNPNGSVNVTFPEFTCGMYDTIDYVVYERVYVKVENEDGTTSLKLIGRHEDLTDTNQQVYYTDTPTGDDTPIALFIGLFVLAMAGIGLFVWKKRKLNKK